MVNQSRPKHGRRSFKVGGILFLIVASVFWFWLISGRAPGRCLGLKPYNNLGDLLYQVYINLDNNCLFTMPVAELEKAWDTKILSAERLKPGQFLYQLGDSSDFSRKPYKSERDAFYLEREVDKINDTVQLSIIITKEYLKKHGTLFPDGNFPKQLPPPMRDSFPLEVHGRGDFLKEDVPSSTKTPTVSEKSVADLPAVETEATAVTPAQAVPVTAPAPVPAPTYSRHHIWGGDYSYYWINFYQTAVIQLNTFDHSVTRITITDKMPSGL